MAFLAKIRPYFTVGSAEWQITFKACVVIGLVIGLFAGMSVAARVI